MENGHLRRVARGPRLGLRTTGHGGDIVAVQGGHIVRSTSRKDRHSKVCTAKGPRDRRVRLSAHTAIKFYDVQDRLGFDRPSKAVDWLIKKAKAAIDELDELPPWKPTAGTTPVENLENEGNGNCYRLSGLEDDPDEGFGCNQMGIDQNLSFLPVTVDSVKSCFPAGGSVPPAEVVSRTQNQDLKLSLQSVQDPISYNKTVQGNDICFDGFSSGSGSGWSENGGMSGFGFNSASIQTTPLFGRPTTSQLLNYISRGPLQSSNTPAVRAWDPPRFSGAGIDEQQTLDFGHLSSMPGFTPGVCGFPGFDVPARIRCGEEERDGLSDKPSSASSNSRH